MAELHLTVLGEVVIGERLLPTIEERLALMGICTPADGLYSADGMRFAQQLIHGSRDRVVRRRDDARRAAEDQQRLRTLWDRMDDFDQMERFFR